MNRSEVTALLKHALSADQLTQVLAAFQEPSGTGSPQIGTLCRWDGACWEPLTGPEAEEAGSEAFLATYDLLIALWVLDGKVGVPSVFSDPAAWWHNALEQAEDAYNRLGRLMERWGDALYDAQTREDPA
jgi:hypothetical protein